MKTNLSGRIRRLSLPPSKVLFPVYEAVANALQAIGDSGRRDGRIIVELRRQDVPFPDAALLESRQAPIHSIVIRDNGVGMDADHMAAFEEVDTLFRADRGGKGVGRLTWLKVFGTASIESVYRTSEGYRRRSFTFALPTGVVARKVRDEPCADGQNDTYTSVTLSEISADYSDQLTHRVGTIAALIMRHFLPALLSTPHPSIVVRDAYSEIEAEPANVTAYEQELVKVKETDFVIHHMKIRGAEARQHRIFRCADGREVESERLTFLPEQALLDEDNRTFFYHAYVFSPFLDSRVSELRTNFHIESERSLYPEELSRPEIADGLRAATERFLAPELRGLRASRDDRVQKILTDDLEDLGYIREQNRDELDQIPLTASPEQIKQAIHGIHQRNQSSGRTLLKEIVSTLKASTKLDLRHFEATLHDKIERITLPHQADLASYMLYRRSIIEIYGALLEKGGDGFEKEAAIHNLIFPMGRDLDTSKMYRNHNLWLLDDRLASASYVASNRELREHRILYAVDSDDTPDIACYFPLGFSEDDLSEELRSVIIVELKRPGPISVNKREENPWQQVTRYVQTIRKEGLWTKGPRQGARVKASDDTRFYVYIVCDTEQATIERMKYDFGFRPIFDGWYRWDENTKIYAELWPLKKVFRDARRRHRAFFDRLGEVGQL